MCSSSLEFSRLSLTFAGAAKIDPLAHALTHVFPLCWFLLSSKNSFNAFQLMHPKMSKARPN